MKLSWRRRTDDAAGSPGRGLTGPARAAALGVADSPDVEADLEPGFESEPAAVGAALSATPAVTVPASPGPNPPAGSKPVMLTLTTRARIEETEREAAQPVRRRMERGMFGGSAPTGGGCSSGGCG
ncbi:conserved hypothetical protein [Frankia sp. AiPs1]|uniref:hypothetical protein n=1 Tax=Frankia sp. AiPa1 TaxID=573492 RepID=UPI00202B2B2C|nr:hypothetical protein [Frankia sp. AiPa1]MCL9757777.1 hypothetical protein [Frankia sp. AiPa1]